MIEYQHGNSSIPYNYDALIYPDFEYVTHLHRDPELVCVLEGEVTAFVEDRTERLCAGDFALILRNQVHGYRTEHHSKALVIVFAEEYVRDFRTLLAGKEGKTSRFTLSEEDRKFFLRKLLNRTPHRLEICSALSLACGEYLKQKEAEGLFPSGEKKADLLHQILTYVTGHYTENLTLTAMAEELGYEPHYLSRCFHRYFQKNFKQFINEYRLHHARQLLADPKNKLSIIDIAYASGFQSVRNFNRVFREAENAEPRRRKTE